MPDLLLDVQGLETCFNTQQGMVHAVNGVSFGLKEGETLGSGGRKRLRQERDGAFADALDPDAARERSWAGSAMFFGQDLLHMSNEEIRHVRGAQISMVFQDPMTSLNPVLTIGQQMEEPLTLHVGMNQAAGARSALPSCWSSWAFRRPRSVWATIRTSSPAACASA